MELIRSHDALFRFVFGEPAQMAELLRACLPGPVALAIDWSTLRRAPDSFVDEALKERRTDLLFSAYMGDVLTLLYVVPEHKSEDERFTAWQIAGYVMRIIEQWRSENPKASDLPVVLPFVLYHGERPWRSPRSPHELVDLRGCDPEVARFLGSMQMHLPFLLLDLARVDESQIEAMQLSAVTGLTLRFLQLLRTCPPDQAGTHILRWQHLVVALLDHQRGRDVLSALFSWYMAGAPASHETLRTVMTKIHEENPPMRSLLDLVLEMGEERGIQKGLEKGLEKGGLRALRTMLDGLLRARFGEIPANIQERLAAADAESLQAWGLRVLTAAGIDDVFAER
ncbi:MAG TPA: Rpn family recombination-promoting nuclease/putative transposase [Planctomycetota bacterium]|nr:Rpn family recombination-promoting nuclease/putative transposase [Planctomycetota bacterium]